MKKLIFLGTVLKDITNFSPAVKGQISFMLEKLQENVALKPQELKYIPTVGIGVYELRIKLEQQYRVFYVAKFAEAIYVLHAFVKKTKKTSSKDIELGIKRFKALLKQRGET